ncbi:response regulator [Achromobacter sp. K91]|uniref:response regulator n=1 Tax=Achromobacter sp. K91 TaxID=2292262 RepID=UPI001314F47E|nr:response regulator [Achromobacter sp. K91]
MDESAPLTECRILVVEDEYVIAETLCEALGDDGATIVGVVGWLDEAVRFARNRQNDFNCAVVDVNLHGDSSYSAIDAMLERDVYVVLLTGFGKEALKSPYCDLPRCQKPFNQRALQTLLSAGMAARHSR